MKGVAVLAVTVLAGASAAVAKDYPSGFMFTFSAPDTWLVMTKAELASNPVLANADAGLKAKVQSGALEVYYDRATSDATFTDYVDVWLGAKGTIPNTPDEAKAECTQYADRLAKAAGRPLALAVCEGRTVGAAKTFYVEHDGRTPDTVTMQYQFLRQDGKLLFVRGRCKKSSLDKFRPDFEAIVKSIRFS